MAAVKKYVKKQAKRAGKYLKKRYTTKKGSLNVKQIVKDVQMLKNVINAEVKRTGDQYHQSSVGQINGTGSGHYVYDISPTMLTLGTAYNQRTGNSIKLKSGYINLQFIQQSATNQNVRGIVEIYMRKQDTVGIVAYANQLFNPTAFVTGGVGSVIDYNSTRNPDYFNDYIMIRRKHFNVPGDALNPSINRTANVKLPISFAKKNGQHCRWDTSGTYTDKQFCVVVRLDSGNLSSLTAGTWGRVPTNAVNTGLDLGLQFEWFYYDN